MTPKRLLLLPSGLRGAQSKSLLLKQVKQCEHGELCEQGELGKQVEQGKQGKQGK